MFKKDKCYSGETANKMVQNMVIGYKTKIKVLKRELKDSTSKVSELECKLDEETRRSNNLFRSVIKHKDNYNRLLSKNKQLYDDVTRLKYEKKVLQEQIDKLQAKKSSSENPFVSRDFLTSYELDNFNEMKFHLCEMRNGKQYIDARKYSRGFPTRKGICLDMGNFTAFIQYCRKALSKAVTRPEMEDLF